MTVGRKYPHGSGFQYTDSRRVSRLISDRVNPHDMLTAEIGPAYAEYRRRWDLARSFRVIPPFPLHVDYEMKFRCNLRCPMCLMSLDAEGRAAYGQSDRELSAAKVLELAAEGAAEGQRAMGFGGLWEPLLAPELPDIVAEARSLGLVDVMFNTNGLLLTEKVGRALIEAGLTRLMISLDADTPETYARMRVGSDFETVSANIRNFMALRRRMGRVLPLVRLSFCRTAINEQELEPFLDRWHEVVDFFSIQTYGRYAGAAPPDFPASRLVPPPPGRCAQPHKRLLVRHTGEVMPCCDASGVSLIVGDVHQNSLAEIWRGEKLAALRETFAPHSLKLCETCLACQSKF
ncbi:MAG: radical SAM protein [Candidatus Adiutrix sp.]|jgi:radical SAM protein with 4Fe4S-binding SPASM domain|nr:radical SAM protein [Candidatus Adiutrix sp.]